MDNQKPDSNEWAVPDALTFLQKHWQQQPKLLKAALPNFKPTLDANDLAGLACEEGVESRIVLTQGDEKPWQVMHGPFAEDVFGQLPERGYTLLVQDADKHYPPVAKVLEHFRFLPDWRIDDVMISYAAPGGSVGPHFDQYDVFLLQVEGQRHWKWGKLPGWPEQQPELLDGCDLSVLKHFEASDEATLSAGDILYLPPGVAHHGVAVDDDSNGDCMTWSIGFRAPAVSEMLGDISDQIQQSLPEHLRYTDPRSEISEQDLTESRATDGRHGLIGNDALQQAMSLLNSALQPHLNDPAWIAKWFGCMQTSPKAWLQPAQAPNSVIELWVKAPLNIERHPGSRWAMTEQPALLFATGKPYDLSEKTKELARYLSDKNHYKAHELKSLTQNDEALALLGELVASGNLIPIETE